MPNFSLLLQNGIFKNNIHKLYTVNFFSYFLRVQNVQYFKAHNLITCYNCFLNFQMNFRNCSQNICCFFLFLRSNVRNRKFKKTSLCILLYFNKQKEKHKRYTKNICNNEKKDTWMKQALERCWRKINEVSYLPHQ